eukprot:350242-Chlamydomonas_euryale.AAC.15
MDASSAKGAHREALWVDASSAEGARQEALWVDASSAEGVRREALWVDASSAEGARREALWVTCWSGGRLRGLDGWTDLRRRAEGGGLGRDVARCRREPVRRVRRVACCTDRQDGSGRFGVAGSV